MKKFLEMATIVENEAIIPEVWKMVFHAPQIAREAQPGQFVNVHRDGGQTFLRRPFGIVDADAETGHVTIIYRLVGKGTEEMKGLRSGDALSVEGPLGEGVFTTTPGQVLLAGGGVGLAPLIFLAKRLDHPIVLVAGIHLLPPVAAGRPALCRPRAACPMRRARGGRAARAAQPPGS